MCMFVTCREVAMSEEQCKYKLKDVHLPLDWRTTDSSDTTDN